MRSLSISVTQVSSFHVSSAGCNNILVPLGLVYNFYVLAGLQAIKIFAEARPPGIYKPDYIDALYRFYHEMKPESVICPPTPEWKRSSDLDLNGEAVRDDDDDGGSAALLNVCIV